MKRLATVGLGSILLVSIRLWARLGLLWGEPDAALAVTEVLVVIGLLLGGCALRFLLPYVIFGLQQIGEKGWKAWPKFEAKYLSAFALAFIGYGVTLVTVPGAVLYLAGMQPLAVVALAYMGQDLGVNAVKRAQESRGRW